VSDVTRYFGDRADDYARFRPSYPPAAMAATVEGLGDDVRAVDVGCGTGIATRLLGAAGAQVTGIEPNEAMRAQAIALGGERVRYLEGTAEATGLEAGSTDLVLCAQAFHWFDGEAALAEFHRILRPGGRLALMWNVRQDQIGFAAAYAEVVRRAKEVVTARGRLVRNARSGDPAASGHFTGLRKLSFPNDHVLDWSTLVGRLESSSYFPRDEPHRGELLELLRQGFDAHEQDGRIVMAQVTELTLCDRIP